jgi:hypothetical protein
VLLVSVRARADDSRVEWNPEWPRFRATEGLGALGFGLAAGAAAFLYPDPPGRWNGPLPFDEAIRNSLVLSDRSARQATAHASDLIYYGLILYPPAIDNLVMTLAVHRNPDVALQLALIDMESYAVTGAIALTAEKVGRVRPMARECANDPDYDYKCASEKRLAQSFLSGHTTIAFAGAGLVCVHHQHFPLFGGNIADPIACATAMIAASAAGAMRIMSDNHYGSDVILGAAVGVTGGYILPELLHFHFGGRYQPRGAFLPTFHVGHGPGAIVGAVTPVATPDYAGLALMGVTE